MAIFLSFSSNALTSQTTRNAIQGSAPYLTFDGGRTRVVNTNDLLGITLSNGSRYTPSNNPSSSSRPIELPTAGESFADIGMLVPTDTNSVALSSLIGPPYNYWGDDDGDSGVTATGSLSLSIVDKYNQAVSRSTVLTVCNAPYRVRLSSTIGTLTTRYGVPNRSDFSGGIVNYYINPRVTPVVCFAKPFMVLSGGRYSGPASMWDSYDGFIPQSTAPSLYGRNFPTTGANNLYFDLLIGGVNQPLSWSPVSRGGITATMTNSTATSVRVTLTGPYATESQQNSSSPSRLPSLSLPQTFELVGRDSRGNPVLKYGFTLKQWFVNRGSKQDNYSNILSWCDSIGYRLVKVKDLTNASCRNTGVYCPEDSISATPTSQSNNYTRHIDAGFFSEWGTTNNYSGVGFRDGYYWTSDPHPDGIQYLVYTIDGRMTTSYADHFGLCAYP